MKSATLPAVRVEQEFRDELESVLADGETLSAFMEKTLREAMERRRTQAEFIKRGMAALARYKAGEEAAIPASEVLAKLEAKLEAKLAAAKAAKAAGKR